MDVTAKNEKRNALAQGVSPRSTNSVSFQACLDKIKGRNPMNGASRSELHAIAAPAAVDPWDELRLIETAPRYHSQARTRLISSQPDDPASQAFDLLRTRLMRALNEKGWTRVAVTAPTAECGKTFTAANLAISMSRLPNMRALLLDMDLRKPGLARTFDVRNVGPIEALLTGMRTPRQHLFRIGHNLALGLNDSVVDRPVELLHQDYTCDVFDHIQDTFDPDIMLFDLPPLLACDDVEAMLPQVDGVLLVASGTQTTAGQIAECERLLLGQAPLLGVVLNQAEAEEHEIYDEAVTDSAHR